MIHIYHIHTTYHIWVYPHCASKYAQHRGSIFYLIELHKNGPSMPLKL